MTQAYNKAPSFTTEQASALLQELYTKRATQPLLCLPSERDQNFLVTDGESKYVLKIYNANEERAVVEMQNEVLRHLHMCGLTSLQKVCSTAAGSNTGVTRMDGSEYMVRLLTYIEGSLFATSLPHNPALLHSLGQFLGRMSKALSSYHNDATKRYLKWDLKEALWARPFAQHINDPDKRSTVQAHFARFEQKALTRLPHLRQSVIHNDANDYNIIVGPKEEFQKEVQAVIDFGDVVYSSTIFELAIAVAYAILDQNDPLLAATHVVRGYHEQFALTEQEVELLFILVCTRLSVSVTNSAYQQTIEPDNKYLVISEAPAWKCLLQFQTFHPNVAHYMFRWACNMTPYCINSDMVTNWLKTKQHTFSDILGEPLTEQNIIVVDISIGGLEMGNLADIAKVENFSKLTHSRSTTIAVGRYNEVRAIYLSDSFASIGGGRERRTVHIGMDLNTTANHPICAPFRGTVHSFKDNAQPFDYGPAIILQHDVDYNGKPLIFYTLYGHLTRESLVGLHVGMEVAQGQPFCFIGSPPTNGNWPPHVHFQIIVDMLALEGDFPGVALPSQREVWLSICPDPNLVVKIPRNLFPEEEISGDEILRLRNKHISKNYSTSYKKPLHIVRGYMQYLYDDEGQAYLDGVNNVSHVGHCHPDVVRAGQQQMNVLNTNTRYLHPNLVKYAKRLCATLPPSLSVCFFVCSGSEANELALRIARTHTKRKDFIVVDGAYHGNTANLVDVSPYKFNGKGGSGKPEHVHTVCMPDVYRGVYKKDDVNAGKKYAEDVKNVVEDAHQRGNKIAGFFCEAILGCGGQVVLPPGYLEEAFYHIRQAGGVCIADEVQTGFGRVGSHFWAFETQDVIPDIVTMGKPIGNGHPMGAVVTTPEIAASFCNGMEYFNTFGGNPVSCATGMAVLEVMEREGLQKHALVVGTYLLDGLENLKRKHKIIGDVRGMGLFVGIELVLNRVTLEPAPEQASYISNRMSECGILISTDGPLHNVLKLKPPLVFSQSNATHLIAILDMILQEDFVKL